VFIGKRNPTKAKNNIMEINYINEDGQQVDSIQTWFVIEVFKKTPSGDLDVDNYDYVAETKSYAEAKRLVKKYFKKDETGFVRLHRYKYFFNGDAYKIAEQHIETDDGGGFINAYGSYDELNGIKHLSQIGDIYAKGQCE
jgi:hypothetical protein